MPDAVIEYIMLLCISDCLLQQQRCLEKYMSHMELFYIWKISVAVLVSSRQPYNFKT